MNWKKCTLWKKGKAVVLEENGRSLVINNPDTKNIGVVTVDGCLINDDTTRCDYFFEVRKPAECEAFVELKGADIRKAIEQLKATIAAVGKTGCRGPRRAYIVASRVPRAGPKIQREKKEFAKKQGVPLVVGTTRLEITV